MIVVDTTVLVYAVGGDHALAEPCRELVRRIGRGQARATTTLEVLQEFAHVRARRRGRPDAVSLTRRFATLFHPPVEPQPSDLERGLGLFVRYEQLGAFDAVLAAVALRVGAEGFVSADRRFAGIDGLPVLDPAAAGFLDAIAGL